LAGLQDGERQHLRSIADPCSNWRSTRATTGIALNRNGTNYWKNISRQSRACGHLPATLGRAPGHPFGSLIGSLNFRDQDTRGNPSPRRLSFQLKSGRTSAPRLPQAWQTNRGPRSDRRKSSDQASPLIARGMGVCAYRINFTPAVFPCHQTKSHRRRVPAMSKTNSKWLRIAASPETTIWPR